MLTGTVGVTLAVNRDFTTEDASCHLRVEIFCSMLEENIPDAIKIMQKMLFDVFIALPNFKRELTRKIERTKSYLAEVVRNPRQKR